MPTYEFPVPTIESEVQSVAEHSVHLPINKEIADELKVDGRAEVRFTGVIKEIDSGFSDDSDYSIRIDISKIEVYPENEFTELSDDD